MTHPYERYLQEVLIDEDTLQARIRSADYTGLCE